MLGAGLALGIFLAMASGLILEPLAKGLIEPSGEETNAVKIATTDGLLVYGAIGFLAGLGNEWAFQLLNRAASAVGGNKAD